MLKQFLHQSVYVFFTIIFASFLVIIDKIVSKLPRNDSVYHVDVPHIFCKFKGYREGIHLPKDH